VTPYSPRQREVIGPRQVSSPVRLASHGGEGIVAKEPQAAADPLECSKVRHNARSNVLTCAHYP